MDSSSAALSVVLLALVGVLHYGTAGHSAPSGHTFFSTVRRLHALGSLLAARSPWIEPHAVTRWPQRACRDPDHAERHATP
jgi:hypothetical membrane protein